MANPNNPHHQQNRPQQNRPQQNQPTHQPQVSQPVTPHEEEKKAPILDEQEKKDDVLAAKIAEEAEYEMTKKDAKDLWNEALLNAIADVLLEKTPVPVVKRKLQEVFVKFSATERDIVRKDLAGTKIKNIVESIMMDIVSITSDPL